ncbi:MAG TPA: DUF1697 domain-containing protein [Gaiellaceae bacterium]
MARYVVLLRGINLGSRNRIAMPKLRAALESAGLDDVRTYLQSGNVVVSSRASPANTVRGVIADEFGLDIAVVTRTRADLAKVVAHNPLRDVATNPKRYQVSFCDAKPSRDAVRLIEAAAAKGERVVVHGREIYAWHPDTIARSKLWTLLAGSKLGVTATARNWTTVEQLLELADAPAPS